METDSPRALRIRPMLAAVMPFPSEEVTPPVTKTYFATGQVLRGFSHATGRGPPRQGAAPRRRARRRRRRASRRIPNGLGRRRQRVREVDRREQCLLFCGRHTVAEPLEQYELAVDLDEVDDVRLALVQV